MQVFKPWIDCQRMGQQPTSCIPSITESQGNSRQGRQQCRLKSVLKKNGGIELSCPQLLNQSDSPTDPLMVSLAVVKKNFIHRLAPFVHSTDRSEERRV